LRRKATAWLWPATNPCPQLVREQVKRHIEERHTTPEMAARIATAIESAAQAGGEIAKVGLEADPDRSTPRVF
jgi:hypothetical protein